MLSGRFGPVARRLAHAPAAEKSDRKVGKNDPKSTAVEFGQNLVGI